MRTILCYGDSNTWGSNPEHRERFSEDVRWPGVLRREIGEEYRVIEEELNGTTTIWDDSIGGSHKNGRAHLIPYLESHKPLDLVTPMFGTNHLTKRFSVSASDIAQSAASLADIRQSSGCGLDGGAPEVLLISPPPLGKLTDYAETFEGSEGKLKKFSGQYRRLAEQYRCDFLDASVMVVWSDIDGIQVDASEHRKLGEAVAALVGETLG